MNGEPLHVRPTQRAALLLVVALSIVVISVLTGSRAYAAGIALALLCASMSGYATLASLAMSRCVARIEVVGRVEGSPIEARITIENRGLVPIAFAEVSIEYSPHLRLREGPRAALLTIPPRSQVSIRLVFEGRVGRHYVGPLRAVVRDFLGLYRSVEMAVGEREEFRVYPRVSEVVMRRLVVRTRSVGITRSREPGLGIEFHSVREYRPGDDPRRVDWKHFAATRRLVVKEMEREEFLSLLFLVDATPPMFFGPYGYTPFEHVARIVASIARYVSMKGDLMGIVIATRSSCLARGMARGRRGFAEVLRGLSETPFDVDSSSEEERCIAIQRCFRKALEVLPRERNLVLAFTVSGGPSYFEALRDCARRVASMGNEVVVVVPISVEYEARGLDPWSQTIYRIKTYASARQEMEFARSLNRAGVRAIALLPRHIPQRVVSIIESLRA